MIHLLFAALAAQEFGAEWLDRVTHDREQARYPLSVRPLDARVQAGAVGGYDSNLFLEPDHPHASSFVVPFARARVDYAAPRWDAAADLLVGYKEYFQQKAESDDQERLYGRLRYAGPRLSLELAEIFRHESDPLDAQFSQRAERLVSTTTARAAVEVLPDLTLEGNLLAGLVFYRDPVLDDSDNAALRADVGLAFRLHPALEAVVQAGALRIDYFDGDAPDAAGWYARAGLRGEPAERVSVTALVGVTEVESDRLPPSGNRASDTTGDVAVNVRYEPTSTMVFYADYTRGVGFGQAGDPWEIVDRVLLLAEWEAAPAWTVRGRVQHDRTKSTLGVRRRYWSVGPSVSWGAGPLLRFEVSVAWRHGDVTAPGDSVFDEFLAQAGFVLSTR